MCVRCPARFSASQSRLDFVMSDGAAALVPARASASCRCASRVRARSTGPTILASSRCIVGNITLERLDKLTPAAGDKWLQEAEAQLAAVMKDHPFFLILLASAKSPA